MRIVGFMNVSAAFPFILFDFETEKKYPRFGAKWGNITILWSSLSRIGVEWIMKFELFVALCSGPGCWLGGHWPLIMLSSRGMRGDRWPGDTIRLSPGTRGSFVVLGPADAVTRVWVAAVGLIDCHQSLFCHRYIPLQTDQSRRINRKYLCYLQVNSIKL